MENKKTKVNRTLNYYMRALHRDIGFLVIGLTIIYSLSGVLLVYRDTNILKHDVVVRQEITKNLTTDDLSKSLYLRDFKAVKEDGNRVYFQDGTYITDGKYDKSTGIVTYTEKQLPQIFNKFTNFHMTSTNSGYMYWFSVLYGLMLFFLAISSFWMFKPGSKMFKRGAVLTLFGAVLSIVLIWNL